MRFLLVTLGSIGDFLPFVAVAEALRARGHRVVLASNAGYAPLAQMTGFEFAAIWDKTAAQRPLDDVLERDPQAAWQAVHDEMLVPATHATYDCVAHYARTEPCVVLASWSAFGARLAHEKLGVPLCTAYLSPHAITQSTVPPGGHAVGFFPRWFCPDSLPDNVTPTGFPMFADAQVPALPAELERFLRDGPAPVIFTPGSFMRRSGAFFRESLAACRQLGLRAIFLTPHADQVPAGLPPGIVHLKYAPLQRLAERGAALVYHGGIGTCAQAMRAGIPQLVTPVFFDQFDNAARVAALGLGIAANRYRRDEIAGALQDLLQSGAVKQNCSHVRALFGGPDPVDGICTVVELLVPAM